MVQNIFKHNLSLTSQTTHDEQFKHLAFNVSGVKAKQIKMLLDEFPEHFIVNEGKDAKKFIGGGIPMSN